MPIQQTMPLQSEHHGHAHQSQRFMLLFMPQRMRQPEG
jgi:hypothetical protein